MSAGERVLGLWRGSGGRGRRRATARRPRQGEKVRVNKQILKRSLPPVHLFCGSHAGPLPARRHARLAHSEENIPRARTVPMGRASVWAPKPAPRGPYPAASVSLTGLSSHCSIRTVGQAAARGAVGAAAPSARSGWDQSPRPASHCRTTSHQRVPECPAGSHLQLATAAHPRHPQPSHLPAASL
jgi:hypothetical protein